MRIQTEQIKAEANRLGFSFCGFAPVRQTPHFKEFFNWAASGMAGEMDYLSSDQVISSRENPIKNMDQTQSVMVLGLSYAPNDFNENNLINLDRPTGKIAAYAGQRDYHKVLKEKCTQLIDFINATALKPLKYRIFIDSGPVMEKDFAYLSGLGWIGKNSLFFHPETGSYCVLVCVFLNHHFTTGEPYQDDPCGDCRLCIEACPTHCITENRTLDARRCISYLTIENKGEIPYELRDALGEWVFGCDVCQQVCPINREILVNMSKPRTIPPRIIETTINLHSGLDMTANQFKERYQSTPIIRAGHDGFLRNLIIAAGNSRSHDLLDMLNRLLSSHPSPLIRSHTSWAIRKIRPI